MRTIYELGALRLDVAARVLSHEGDPMRVGARGVSVLAALVSRAGENLSKNEIIDAAWPGLVVEEANLAVQVSAIRRALAHVPGGEQWIETRSRHGYRFVGPVKKIEVPLSDAPAAPSRRRTNLPQALTSFVGREHEIAAMKQVLPTTRLLSIVGTGGVGKTRLAQEACAEMLDAYCDGIWFVDLAPIADPDLITSALAHVLGVREVANKPLLRSVCDHVRGKQMLVIMDNCEHLRESTSRIVSALCGAAPRLTVVATSRERLHVAGEHAYPIGPLPLPRPDDDAARIERSDAVRLFVARARQYRRNFDLDGQRAQSVARICVRLDGLPLALELAAARIAVLPVQEIERLLHQRLRLLTSGTGNELARHQTLRAMIDWSHDLLDDAEQQLFRRLSVFAGGFTIAAAQSVGSVQAAGRGDVVNGLLALIDKSLVIADESGDRYRMLETVREYAGERLSVADEADAARRRHRDHFLAFAEIAEPQLKGNHQQTWFDRLQDEHDNLRAALTWSTDSEGESDSGLRMAGALSRFWTVRGHLREGRDQVAALLAVDPLHQAPVFRARALAAAGSVARNMSDFSHAAACFGEALEIRRTLGHESAVGGLLNDVGLVARDQAQVTSARTLLHESLEIQRRLGDRWGVAAALNNLGLVEADAGDIASARCMHAEALSIRRALADQWGIAASLMNLALVTEREGDYATARELYESSVAQFRLLGDRASTGMALNNVGRMHYVNGDYAKARLRFEESLELRRALDDARGIAYCYANLGNLEVETGDYEEAWQHLTASLAIRRTQLDRMLAESLESLAYLASHTSDHASAARLWASGQKLRERIGVPITAHDLELVKERTDVARAAIGEVAVAKAWEEGGSMPLEQVIDLALGRAAHG